MRWLVMAVVMERVVFRRAGVADVSGLVECRVRFLREAYGHPDDAATQAVRASLRDYFAWAIPAGEFVAWVAEWEGQLVGTGGLVVWRMPARYGGVESGRLGYLLNFYTVPDARRRGIGTRLLRELIGEARSLGLGYLHLHASRDGMGIYKKAGFAEPRMPELVLKLE